jgi:hypothetical protein
MYGPLVFDEIPLHGPLEIKECVFNAVYVYDTVKRVVSDSIYDEIMITLDGIFTDPKTCNDFIDRVFKFKNGHGANVHCVGGTYEAKKRKVSFEDDRSMSFFIRRENSKYFLLCKLY